MLGKGFTTEPQLQPLWLIILYKISAAGHAYNPSTLEAEKGLGPAPRNPPLKHISQLRQIFLKAFLA
ncbi:rCG34230 [Rattus norvegicus]|uniref:RCG34230 n=1 Tax=Rattus norvegicus TaxID=10116 RepID=A6HHS5_RAT|nr:rCG34230 [Rattus norvegicus]